VVIDSIETAMAVSRQRSFLPGVRFGAFEFDPASRELRKQGARIRLRPQQSAVLELLLRNAGTVVTREEVRRRLWDSNTHLDFDRGINKVISRLRDVLGDSAKQPRYIDTIPKAGFRFLAPVDPQVTSIAVLPLVDGSAGEGNDYFADGMTEELITSLCKVADLRVISRMSVMRYKNCAKAPSEVARELGVDAVVEGSVMRAGNKVRITASLILANGELQAWRESYERPDSDVLLLQNEVAAAIAGSVNRVIRTVADAARKRSSVIDADAHQAFLKGRYFWNKRTPPDLSRSLEYFQRAVQIDPQYAQAWAGLADAYLVIGILGLHSAAEVFQKARDAAETAVALNDSLAEAHTSLAEVYKDFDWDWAGAEREFKLSLELNPQYAVAHQFYAQLLTVLCRYKEAIWHMEQACRCDPLSPIVTAFHAFILIQARQYERAQIEAEKALELDPGFALTHWFLAQVHQLRGQQQEAVRTLEHAMRLPGSLPVIEAQLGYAYARSGQRSKAQETLDSLNSRRSQQYVSPMAFAMVHLGMANHDSAFNCLEEAYRTRTFRILALTDPFFSELEADHRYQSLLSRLSVPSPSSLV
jgi:TolB-like protein/Tfp pilus assembly protein PilF